VDLGLAGKRALVTGGTRGIGRAVALALAEAGVNVVACYRQDEQAAEHLRRDLRQAGGDHHIVKADVARAEDIDRLADLCRGLGPVDIVVHNAGIISHVPFHELSFDQWKLVLDSNLTAAYLVVQKVLDLLPAGASIINIGSRAAIAGVPLRAHYTAAKAGIVGLTRSLAKELAPRGIRVNVVAPGVIETGIVLTPEVRKRYESMIAMGRLGRPEEIAGVVMFLASDLSSFVTGETINVDGGI
jgi:3-oxoacyl-[acyl-carrier protein] reductase